MFVWFTPFTHKVEVLVAAVIIGIIGGLLWLVDLRFQRAFHDTLDII